MRKPIPVTILLAAIAVLAAGCASAPAGTPGTPTATHLPVPTPTAGGVTAARCTVSSQVATPSATDSSLFPPPSPADWSRGPATASVVFIEYGDFM
jgi:hypothetical protein